ncbi:MAG: DUF998 domain-containing protein [Anaerolineae bacterium]|nr:DUF998 domain-containing protein [Anaerolineae bacterium]
MPLAGMDWFPAIWLGGCLFGVSVFLVGYLTPNYSHLHQSISELGARNAPYSWLVRWAGFIPLGLGFMLFSLQARELFSNNVSSILFLVIGLIIIIAGIFPTDPHNRRDTFSGKVHAIAVTALLFLLALAPFIFSISALYRNPPTGWFSVFSLSMGMLTLGFFGIMPNARCQQLTALHRKIFSRWIGSWCLVQGLHQRLLLSLFSVWWFVFSAVLALVD